MQEKHRANLKITRMKKENRENACKPKLKSLTKTFQAFSPTRILMQSYH